MAPRKGISNNPQGRPSGTPNKVTASLRAGVDAFVKGKWPEVDQIWERLDDRDKLNFLDKMMRYVLPTLQSTTIDAKVESTSKLASLDDDQLNILIDQILAQDED